MGINCCSLIQRWTACFTRFQRSGAVPCSPSRDALSSVLAVTAPWCSCCPPAPAGPAALPQNSSFMKLQFTSRQRAACPDRTQLCHTQLTPSCWATVIDLCSRAELTAGLVLQTLQKWISVSYCHKRVRPIGAGGPSSLGNVWNCFGINIYTSYQEALLTTLTIVLIAVVPSIIQAAFL